jgi:hypothetical protein
MIPTGKIIVLAYPDTFVRHSTEGICAWLPFFSLGTNSHIKAGHAALVLIENKTGKAFYFDFGRYITPNGYGRVRGANTDAELEIPMLANIDANNILTNLNELLLWLEANPDKTHGEGRLVASLCDHVNFNKAISFINKLQKQDLIKYGAFLKNGTNCSRFVADVLIQATTQKRIKNKLLFNSLFTPSTVGNVQAVGNPKIYEILNQTITSYSKSALLENISNFFDKNYASPQKSLAAPTKNAQLLTGTGSSAWFELFETQYDSLSRILRYNELGQKDFDGIFETPEGFNHAQPFTFTYPSNCSKCSLLQNNTLFTFTFIENQKDFITREKELTA